MATEKQSALKERMAANANAVTTQEDKPLTPAQNVAAYMKNMMPAIQQVLPKHANPERMSRIALNVIRTNPQLLECDINSLMGGVLEAAKLGLEPGMMGQCYLLPYNKKQGNTWVKEAQFIIGYKGLIDLVRRSGQVVSIEARTVYENDEFDYEYGLEDKLYHKPTLKNRGEAIAYYAVCKLVGGGHSFLVMGIDDMNAYRDKYAKTKKNGVIYGPWKDEFDAMARKTVLRQLIKYLPISIENLSNFDERDGSDVHQSLVGAEVVNADDFIPVSEGEVVDEQ